jgi:DNA-binding GntR family transcriptional regulator
VLQIQRTTFDAEGRPFEYLESFFRGDRYVFQAELRNQDGDLGS